MKLIIFHYHLRPGGVRRVIELAAPHLVAGAPRGISSVTLAVGEKPDSVWEEHFINALRPLTVEFFVEPTFNYYSEQRRSQRAICDSIRTGLQRLLGRETPDSCVVWAHNLGLARNLFLTEELIRACDERGLHLLAHHHDWWFDNRWQRWQEVRGMGFQALADAADAVFGSPKTHHVAINRMDWRVLRKHFPKRTTWLPNLAEPSRKPVANRRKNAFHWLQSQLNGEDGPIWLLPCRFLRRKNVAEALLLKQWLRPEAWLVSTGRVTSANEQHYFNALNAAVIKRRLRARFCVLGGDEEGKPTVDELLAASEAVLLTSIQEGFGLPYIEAAAASRPLIARNLPNVAPDLAEFGFRFPQNYDEILVHPSLFDWKAESRRQRHLFSRWKDRLPASCRSWAGNPALLATRASATAIPFSRLTITAQIEVLAQPAIHSWELCAPLNPFLKKWKRRATEGTLRVTPWPAKAQRWLGGKAYARRFWDAAKGAQKPTRVRNGAVAAQAEIIKQKLASEYLYPLLWGHKT